MQWNIYKRITNKAFASPKYTIVTGQNNSKFMEQFWWDNNVYDNKAPFHPMLSSVHKTSLTMKKTTFTIRALEGLQKFDFFPP